MRIPSLLLLVLLCAGIDANLQSQPSQPLRAPFQVYSGYSWLSNSFNGGAAHPLNGWNTGVAFPDWHRLRFKIDCSSFRGINRGDPQRALLIMGGGQYEATFHRERFFAEALLGEAGLNGAWFSTANLADYKNGNTGSHASLAEFLGGGADTPVGLHLAVRVEGGVQHTNFVPIEPLPLAQPYHLAGLPNYFGRLSAGIVWLPRLEPAIEPSYPGATPSKVESEIVVEGLNSIGHFKILANSWWSTLATGGVEYDRHSWGTFAGARLDYSAEIMPFILLRPSKTDVWGNPATTFHESVPGVGIFPIGMRMLWHDGGHVKPFFIARGGMTGYSRKAFSQYASYENFSLDYRVGIDFRVSGRMDVRAGFGILHQSNGFAVPSNPGLDEMNVNAGVSYHLGGGAKAM
jgi:hypothetical protein